MSQNVCIPLIKEFDNPPSPEALLEAMRKYPYLFFLDSALPDERFGRFSFLGCDPFLVFRSKRGRITIKERGKIARSFKGDPFTVLQDILSRYTVEKMENIPFSGGGVGYFSYDLKDHVERLPDKAHDDLGIDDCMVGFYDTVVVYDHIHGKMYILSTGFSGADNVQSRNLAERRLEYFSNIVEGAHRCLCPIPSIQSSPLTSNFSKVSYMRAIACAKDYIRRGDIYQVNLSQRFTSDMVIDPFALYRRIRRITPAPFGAFLSFADVVIMSSSPERFLAKRDARVTTRPIKGTRPRGRDRYSDQTFARELIASSKDRAEHTMIVDLERNDLGKICRYGTVKVDEFMALEKYENVFHLVSTVSGHLRHGIGAIDALRAVFPGGSITGAPKIRTMEIIEELEPVKRSIYTGAIGYASFSGDMDTSIVIRTCIAKGGKVYLQVGGGIVADSDPDQEYQETLDKAAGLFEALGGSLCDGNASSQALYGGMRAGAL